MIRVLIVDDHPVVRAGLEAILRTEPGLAPVGSAQDGPGLWQLLRRTRPDVVVLDRNLVQEDGLEICRALRAEPAAPAVVMYTVDPSDDLRERALEAGAAQVVDKGADPGILLDALRVAGRRRAPAIEDPSRPHRPTGLRSDTSAPREALATPRLARLVPLHHTTGGADMADTVTTGDGQSQAQEKVKDAAGQAREKAQEGAERAREGLSGQVDQRSTQAGQQVRRQSDDIRSVAQQLREQGKDGPAKLADQAADRAQKVGSWLEDSDGDQILGDVEDFARRNPWAVALGGLALGFAASRVLRASSSDRYQSGAYGSRRRGYAGQLPSPGTAPYGAGTSYPEPPVAATPPVGGTLGPERL